MKRLLAGFLALAMLFSYMPLGFADEGTSAEIQELKEQVQQLLGRIEQLEKQQALTKEEAASAKAEVAKIKESGAGAAASRVNLSNALSKLSLKGRAAIGYFDSGKAGSFPSGSFEVPDAKIQFSFQPDDINTVVMRMNFSNATLGTPNLDYFYLQSKDFLPMLKNKPLSLSSRLGRFKLGFGEETLSDNRVEGVLPSNSAAASTVSDEGAELNGKIKLADLTGIKALKPLGWVVSLTNGTTGVTTDNSAGKAAFGKVYYTPIDPLYLSFSYYDSGNLQASNAEMSIAGLVTTPVGGAAWERKVWETFARYDFGKGKKPLDPPAYSDSKAIVRLSYGGFHDECSVDREGSFGFVEGTYNLTKKFYTAGRYSFVNLDGDANATLNSVTANKYDRFSLGVGYRWSENTIVKLGYDWNKNKGNGIGVDDADDNLLSAVVGTQF